MTLNPVNTSDTVSRNVYSSPGAKPAGSSGHPKAKSMPVFKDISNVFVTEGQYDRSTAALELEYAVHSHIVLAELVATKSCTCSTVLRFALTRELVRTIDTTERDAK
jgi:isopentenyl phosphate kinase